MGKQTKLIFVAMLPNTLMAGWALYAPDAAVADSQAKCADRLEPKRQSARYGLWELGHHGQNAAGEWEGADTL